MRKLLNRLLPPLYGAYFNFIALFSEKMAAEKAFTLFVTPRKGKVLPIQKAFLEDAMDQVITIGGMGLQTYHWPGEKERVLLLHGWESNTFRWKKLIKELRNNGFDIVAFDAPAHGKSTGVIFNVILYAECVEEICKVYKPKHIVGHSVGGMTAVYHQYAYDSKGIEKIVTIGSPSEFPEIMDQYQKLLRFNNRVMRALDNYLYKHFGFRIKDFSTSQFAKELKIKGLLIHDELDTIAPFSSSERVHASWEGSKLIRTRGLGHSMHQEQVNQQIADFLKS
ncbi:alpha/beta fold hydrolase [Lentiprolixibacter aurantiacus]|uniref:Alpha/beta hydrolase n=1 Tax=Lentiprolixibacter aurantiacus TaxID=2993939 RepID=A0AAE3MNF7_9FLAO|nr:alpha/beta hydrolase [Lentiprolixibacter aurantiacus]MCX2720634.1 alpha/beta hydrolase [Lentiprolixibacter aurantiacus]